LRRWLEVSGYKIKHVKNITDVGHLVADRDEGEDKIEKAAKEEKSDPLKIARKYEALYLEDEKSLNILEPFKRPRAAETIKEMVKLVEILVKKGHAYETDDGVYFSVESFPRYGSLSGNTLVNLSAGARVEVGENKKHPADFALWKKCVGANANHILRWDSPWGEGFPGWHIECSAMSTKFLGEQIDIHTGGEDNIFPHHECEIAQSECASGMKFVRFWVHRRRINMGEDKMSKSLGNILTVPDISEKGFSPLDLRYFLISVHYRTNLKFDWKGMEDAKKARRKVVEWMTEMENGKWKMENEKRKIIYPAAPLSGAAVLHQQHPSSGSDLGLVNEFHQRFTDEMDCDLNTPGALAAVFDCMAWSRNQPSFSKSVHKALQEFVAMARGTFGCFEPKESEDVPSEVLELLGKRKSARDAKDFESSDLIRAKLKKMGWEVRDEGDWQKIVKI